MRRWVLGMLVVGLALIGLAACGQDDDDPSPAGDDPAGNVTDGSAVNGGGVGTLPPTTTPRPPAPRSEALPKGDPAAFEAPLTVGPYVRQDVQGQVTASGTGGQQAVYRSDDGRRVQLTVFHMASPAQALDKVRDQLASASVVRLTGKPHLTTAVAYAEAEMQQGHLIAWSHYEWVFFAYTSGPREALATFMDAFPY